MTMYRVMHVAVTLGCLVHSAAWTSPEIPQQKLLARRLQEHLARNESLGSQASAEGLRGGRYDSNTSCKLPFALGTTLGLALALVFQPAPARAEKSLVELRKVAFEAARSADTELQKLKEGLYQTASVLEGDSTQRAQEMSRQAEEAEQAKQQAVLQAKERQARLEEKERAEQARLKEKERAEQARLQEERAEQARLQEKEKAEQARRQAEERAKQARLQEEKAEQARLQEKEKAEQARRQAEERAKQVRLQEEKAKQAKLEAERAELAFLQERAEKARLEEEDRLEQEREIIELLRQAEEAEQANRQTRLQEEERAKQVRASKEVDELLKSLAESTAPQSLPSPPPALAESTVSQSRPSPPPALAESTASQSRPSPPPALADFTPTRPDSSRGVVTVGVASAFGVVVLAAIANRDEAVSDEAPGQRVVVLAPPALKGQEGCIMNPALSSAGEAMKDMLTVRLDSGTIFNIETKNIEIKTLSSLGEMTTSVPPGVASTSPAIPAAADTAPGVEEKEEDAEELEFTPGQRVLILGPPAIAGKQGSIVGPALGKTFAVCLDSGSVFNVATENIQDAATPATDSPATSASAAMPATFGDVQTSANPDQELEFTPGQRVLVLGPALMAGKQGTIEGPALGQTYAVRFDSGSVFNIASTSIQDAALPTPTLVEAESASPAIPAAADTAPNAKAEEELEFTPGQRVLILGPPAIAGKQGSVVGPALGDTFAVCLDSGSVFNVATENIQDAVLPAPTISTTPAHAPVTSAASSKSEALGTTGEAVAAPDEEEDLEFTPNQQVVMIGPPAMFGKQGTILGPASGNSFAVRFDSGSVFNIATVNIQDAAAAMPAAPIPAAPAPTVDSRPEPAMDATGAEEGLEFTPGQQVVLLGPPAMAGKQGTIEGPALGNTFAVRFDSGSVYNFAPEHIRSAMEPATADEFSTPKPVSLDPRSASSAPPPVGAVAPPAHEDNQLAKGQQVVVVGEHAMAQKGGVVVGLPKEDPSSGAIRFKSGGVFYIPKIHLRTVRVMPA